MVSLSSLTFLFALFFSSLGFAAQAPGIAWKSPALNFKAVDFAVADFVGDQSLQLAAASSRRVFLYAYPVVSSTPVSVYMLSESQARILSLDASLLGAGSKSKLFVTYYDAALGQVGTIILEFSLPRKNWKRLSKIPYVVRVISGTGEGLFCQQLLDNDPFPMSSIYPIVYEKGEYSSSDKSDGRLLSRWLYSQAAARVGGQNFRAAIISGNRLEISSQGRRWALPGSYGESANRLRWPASSSHTLEFSPRLIFGKGVLFAVHNSSRWGILAESFGMFDRGRIISFDWRNGEFEKNWETRLPGSVSDIDFVSYPAFSSHQIVALWVGASKKSHLWAFSF